MSKKEYVNIPINVKSAGEDTLWTTMSTDDIDRHGESVSQKWNLENFMNNPVVLNSHKYDDTTEAIGRMEALVQKEHTLEGKIKFAINENPKAKIVFDLYKGGFLNAFSVGFIPGEEENELLELSAVTIPANALALAKAKGFDTGEEEVDYNNLTVEQLKEVLKEKGLTTTGNKKELVGRLEDNEEEAEEETEEETKTLGGKTVIISDDMPTITDEEETFEETTEEIKELYTEKAGRVLSASSKKKVQSAINALQELLEADNKSYEEDKEEDTVEEEFEQGEGEEEQVEKIKVGANIKSVIKALHKEISETHEDNLAIKKKNIHKALRNLKA